jgi:hypothetical protein
MNTSTLSNVEGVLSRSEMKSIMAGSIDPEFNDGEMCCLRCNQNSSECDHHVSGCSRTVAEQMCGGNFDPLSTVCVC